MPALSFLVLSIVFGIVAAKATPEQSGGLPWFSRSIVMLALWQATVVTPICAVYWRFYPQYTLSCELPIGFCEQHDGVLILLSFLAIASNFGATCGGFVWARTWRRRKKPFVSLSHIEAMAYLLLLLGFAWLSKKSLWVANSESDAPQATFILKTTCGWLGMALVAASAVLRRWFHQHNISPKLPTSM